jgi:hypothetical protein
MKAVSLGVFILVAFLLVTTLSTDSVKKPQKMGGWRKINVENRSAYKDVIDFLAMKEMMLGKGYQVISVEQQVVAGTNYKLVIWTNQEYREVVVWKQLDGLFKLMSN